MPQLPLHELSGVVGWDEELTVRDGAAFLAGAACPFAIAGRDDSTCPDAIPGSATACTSGSTAMIPACAVSITEQNPLKSSLLVQYILKPAVTADKHRGVVLQLHRHHIV